MIINFDEIRKANIKEYGEGVRHLAFLGRLYADKTHFIFELLQNAEDAKASKIKFILYPDRLEVLHNGRIFDKDDVIGICGVGESTKTEDLTKIGKFGIGFKSVYAYTEKPEVHCKGVHFTIENYVRPYKVDEKQISSGWTTLLVFPFSSSGEDNITSFQQKSFRQISHRLKELNVRTLLFLQNLKEIEFDIMNDKKGVYLRESKLEKEFKLITVIGQQDSNIIDEQWIVFSKPISDSTKKMSVEIAFKIILDKNKKEMISQIKQSYLTVFFPTEKETHLGFLVQGPYRTTPARDNIPQENEWNKKLVNETAKLLENTMQIIKEKGLLSINFLEALPIRVDDYASSWMFQSLCDNVRKTFIEKAYLPTADGQYVKASNAKLVRGKGLRELINNDKLTDLLNKNIPSKWLTDEITQDRTPTLREYLIYELDIEEIDSASFAKKISYEFLCKQSDEWHIHFYEYLTKQEALWRKGRTAYLDGPLRKKEIIRCEDGKNISPFDDERRVKVYLPLSSELNFAVVKRSIYSNDKVKMFLENLGLIKPDICVKIIEEILPIYYNNIPLEDIEINQYQEHINQIFEAVQISDSPFLSQLIKDLESIPWILAENFITGKVSLKKASKVYLPKDDLCMYFENNDEVWFISQEIQIQEEFLRKIGVASKVKIYSKGLAQHKINPNTEINLWSYHADHCQGIQCFDPDTNIDGLESAISSITTEKAIYTWNYLVLPLANFIKGKFKIATRQDFSNSKIVEDYSKFGKIISEQPWIPTNNCEFKKASECSVDDLHPELIKDELLIQQLEILPSRNTIKTESISNLSNIFTSEGIPTELADFIIENKQSMTPDFLKEVFQVCKERQDIQKPTFPSKKVLNPDRRGKKITERYVQTENKKYEKRIRSVKTTKPNHDPKTWLRDQYTNDDDIMVCQMCANEMPFKLKEGDYYFEAVQICDTQKKEDHESYFALCPLCSAKYRHLLKRDKKLMNVFIENIKGVNNQLQVPINLGLPVPSSIQFVESHLHDLKIIL